MPLNKWTLSGMYYTERFLDFSFTLVGVRLPARGIGILHSVAIHFVRSKTNEALNGNFAAKVSFYSMKILSIQLPRTCL